VSTARETVDALLVVLTEERAAIRRVDTAKVAEMAQAKERLAKELGAISLEELATVSNDLPVLRAELRRNGVLLAHARSCVAELLDIAAPKQGGARRGMLRARV
jgi:hypothetical protein